MKRMPLRRAVAAAALLVLTACDGLMTPSSGSSGAPAPLIALFNTPESAVSAFLDAWSSRDYPTMYSRLSVESQGLTTFPVFQQIYEDADTAIGTTGVAHTIHTVELQGRTAAVRYDAVIQSSLFGEITDAGRTMRLVQGGDGSWGVAWTTMDIFNGLAAGARLEAIARPQPRANILDRNGQPIVEEDGTVVTLYAARGSMTDEQTCFYWLSWVTGLPRATLLGMFEGYAPETVLPLGDIDPELYAAYESPLLENCAILSAERQTRRYWGHGAAAHLTGWVGQIPADQLQAYLDQGYNQGALVGQAGVELQYERELAGQADRVLRIIEPGGLIIRELGGSSGRAPQPVTLTIDRDLQLAAGRAFAEAYITAEPNWASGSPGGGSPGGAAVAIDVNTGAILALTSYPTFDPGIFNPNTEIFLVGDFIFDLQTNPRRPFNNRATQEQYPPGSTYKVITTAAAANERLWSASEWFYCGQVWDGRQFGDTRPQRLDWRATEVLEEARFDTGEITMAQALTASCNPFFYQMGALLYRRDPALLGEYARRLGLGQATGMEPLLPEASGQIPTLPGTDAAISAAIGQYDVQVTVIQMARVAAAIANGGTVYRPYVVEQVGGQDGSEPTLVGAAEVVGQAGLDPMTFDVLREGMCAVTNQRALGRSTGQPLGTAWVVFDDPEGMGIAPYSVCGKTGTAQTGRAEPHGWFIAYAPADNPQIAVAAIVEHSREGSETAAPIVRRILDAYFDAPPAPFPYWWPELYVPLNIPEGSTGG